MTNRIHVNSISHPVGRVIIMSGVSGSGKTYLAEKKGVDHISRHPDSNYAILSTYDYFTSYDGHYHYRSRELVRAQADCFRRFIQALENKIGMVIVDNANLTSEDMAPYVMGASAFDYMTRILTMFLLEGESWEIDLLARRNKRHLGAEEIRAQMETLAVRELPASWPPSNDIPVQFDLELESLPF